ncbi:synaptic adhesion-like molecule salm [Holotrichia oblita]|uniref:Synaptic adhesion-like molecule salm n=2 Tax=Holotrichia oblita TaxID=644536 RepID=A0ACB9TF85_HOLOL|nr:synaptic adhesion-like molecule salm [Holotrichia oblita]KAI4465438.1 synaptic adhesion-like molecule salm [Holotrichia oblita]
MRLILLLYVISGYKVLGNRQHTCDITSCEVYEILHNELNNQTCRSDVVKLERKIRSLDQPVWIVSNSNDRWMDCTRGPCKCKPEIKSITCWNTNLKVIPHQQILPIDIHTMYLNLKKNKVEYISSGAFNNLKNLEVLDLTANRIQALTSTDFMNLNSLKELWLDQNYISEIPEDVFTDLANLQALMLQSNNLAELTENTFAGLTNLTSLLINKNMVEVIHPNIFMYTPNLQKLSIDSNQLHFLPEKSLDVLDNLIYIMLAKNPWHCDCSILYLALWISENQNKVWDIQPSCRGPGNLGGLYLKDMTFNNLCDGQWASMLNLSPRIPVKNFQPTIPIESNDTTH